LQTGFALQLREIPIPDPTQVIRFRDPLLYNAACGLITSANGRTYAVYAGGRNDRDIRVRDTYLYDLETTIWTPGPGLPHAESEIYGINYGDTLYIISDVDIIKYNPDGVFGQWKTIFRYSTDAPMKPEGFGTATLVPKSYLECNA